MKPTYTHSGAIIEDAAFDDAAYRYCLTREWVPRPRKRALIVGLNPSKADAKDDDATIRREVGFCRLWGVDALDKANLFGWRETDPQKLIRLVEDPDVPRGDALAYYVGPKNDRYILELARHADLIVVAWGNHGQLGGRDRQVLKLLVQYEVKCFGWTKTFQPKHPVRLPYSTKLEVYKLKGDPSRYEEAVEGDW